MLGLLAGQFPVAAQDLVPIGDIAGGSSVFVFRRSSKPAPRKAVARAGTERTKVQRIETVKKINRQYVALVKVKPQRVRSVKVEPNTLPAVPSMDLVAAAKMFAGVGEYYIDQDELDKALKFFREAVGLDPRNNSAKTGLSEALALKGNSLLAEDQPETARKFFEDSLKNNPNNAAAYYGLGEVNSDLGLDADAIASYEKALSLNSGLTEIYLPLGILYIEKGEIAKADSLLSKAVAAAPGDPETQYFLGMLRYKQVRDQEALAAFRKATAGDPNYAEAYFYIGETLIRLNQPEKAIEEYKRATALKPKYLEALLALANAHVETGNYTAAIPVYKDALKLKNDNIEAYVGLAEAYRENRNYIDAEANYNMAITFFERDKTFNKEEAAEIYAKHGYVIAVQCDINMQKGMLCKWNSGIRSLEAAVALTQNAVDHANLGWAYYKSGRVDLDLKKTAEGRAKLEKAKVSLRKAIEMNPSYVEAPQINLGLALSDLGEYQPAVEVLAKVVNKRSDWTFALNELGRAYYGLKDYGNAAKYFRRAIDKDDKYAWAYYNLAVTEFDAGNKAEAKKAFEKLKKLNNNLANMLIRYTRGEVLK